MKNDSCYRPDGNKARMYGTIPEDPVGQHPDRSC